MISKNKFVKDMKKDEMIEDIFVVKFKKPVEAYKNGYKFELRLGDSTKEIMYKFWGPQSESQVQILYDSIKKDDFVKVKARVNEWNNSLELSANDMNTISIIPEDQIDIRDFIGTSKKNIGEMYSRLKNYIESIDDKEIKQILELLFDEEFSKKFIVAPGSMYKHHNWSGGLLEHTLDVTRIAEHILEIHDKLNRDMVIAGCLIHDIGKVEEFEARTSIKVSTEGMLIGHISIGIERLSKILDAIKIDPIKSLKLKHMILSHHGELEYGSPKKPAFPEALLVHAADELDARITNMQRVKEEATTEDDYIYTQDFGNIFLK